MTDDRQRKQLASQRGVLISGLSFGATSKAADLINLIFLSFSFVVCGLPEPRKDHATVMARFSSDLIRTMNDLTKRLENYLGPDTGDLSLRIGLHSGPVTAGVLRGDNCRFQVSLKELECSQYSFEIYQRTDRAQP